MIAVDPSQADAHLPRCQTSSRETKVECRQEPRRSAPDRGREPWTTPSPTWFCTTWSSPLAAIHEMTRILKPGGSLVLTDLDKHDFEFLVSEHHDRWMGFERDQIHRWLVDAGLVDVRVDCVGADCCATSEVGEAASLSIFVASGRRPRATAEAGPASCASPCT